MSGELSTHAFDIVKSKKRKRTLTLSVSPSGVVRVLSPYRLSMKAIEDFIDSRSDWIRKKLNDAKASAKEKRLPKKGDAVYFLGKTFTLNIAENGENQPACAVRDDAIDVRIGGTSLSQEETEREALTELTLWYKKQARRTFRERAVFFGEKAKISYGKIIVTSPRRRWGSCNSKNDIRLNWRLIMAEPELLDYVVAHELCHVVHKNHSRRFWNLLASVMPDCKSRRKRLREWEKKGCGGF